MSMDSENPSDEGKDIPVQVEQAVHQTAELTQSAVADATGGAIEATQAVAEAAAQMNERSAQSASAFSSETAEAFGAARDRLQSLAGTPPIANQALLDQFKGSTEVLGRGLEASFKSATDGMAEFNGKAIEAWRTNAEAAIAHWKSLASVKSFSEAIALNAEHTRRQMEAMSSQTRELSALAGRIAREAVNPLKLSGR